MKVLSTIGLILGIILTIMGGTVLAVSIATSAGLESIVIGAMFTLCGIVSILDSVLNLFKLQVEKEE